MVASFVKLKVKFRVACLYAPSQNLFRDEFYLKCTNHIGPSIPTVICGNLNAVLTRQRTGEDRIVMIFRGRAPSPYPLFFMNVASLIHGGICIQMSVPTLCSVLMVPLPPVSIILVAHILHRMQLKLATYTHVQFWTTCLSSCCSISPSPFLGFTPDRHISPRGVISYISYRLVTPQRLRFFLSGSRYDFDNYSLKSGRVFKRTTSV